MSRVAAPRKLRRRLAISYAVVAAIAAGALALGSYLVVSSSRLDDSVDSSLAQARTNLLLAGTVLGEPSTRPNIAGLSAFFARRPGFKTVALAGGEAFGWSSGRAEISAGLRRLVRNGDPAFERVRIDGTPYVVAGGQARPSQAEFYFFFSEEALRDDLTQLRTILLVGWAS